MRGLPTNLAIYLFLVFVAVFFGCTSAGQVGLCFLWFYVQELPKAQPAVVLVLKRFRRRGNGVKSHPTDLEKPGIEPATPGLQDIGFPLHHGGFLMYLFFTTCLINSIILEHECYINHMIFSITLKSQIGLKT